MRPIITVIGGSGLLGQALQQYFLGIGWTVDAPSSVELDIRFPIKHRPAGSIIINCAAYTDVDEQEDNPKKANILNHLCAATVAQWCTQNGLKLIHISTDYVFDGKLSEPKSERAQTNPLQIYGTSKLRGEEAVLRLAPTAIVLRLQSLYGPCGKHFFQAMRRAISSVRVVNDQHTAITPTRCAAAAIAELIQHRHFEKISGPLHWSMRGKLSWFEAAKIFFEQERRPVTVIPVSTEEFGARARRPKHSLLSHQKWLELGLSTPPDCVEALCNEIHAQRV